MVMGVGGSLVPMETTCHEQIIQISAHDSNIRRFATALAIAKTWISM
jgi:hypothetical protein